MNQRHAFIAHAVLQSFQDNSAYEDYKTHTPFTDAEYEAVLNELHHLANPHLASQSAVFNIVFTRTKEFLRERAIATGTNLPEQFTVPVRVTLFSKEFRAELLDYFQSVKFPAGIDTINHNSKIHVMSHEIPMDNPAHLFRLSKNYIYCNEDSLSEPEAAKAFVDTFHAIKQLCESRKRK